jgi:hypothetical protein
LIIANDYLSFTNASGLDKKTFSGFSLYKIFHLKSFRRCDIRLASTVDDMYTFSQIDDHITTLIKHSHHPNMDKAKELIDKIEHRGSMNDFKFILRKIFLSRNLSIYWKYTCSIYNRF